MYWTSRQNYSIITWRENLEVWNSSQFDISSEFDIFYSASGLRLVCDSLWTRAWMCEVFIGWQEHSERLWTNHSIAGNMFRILETSLDMTISRHSLAMIHMTNELEADAIKLVCWILAIFFMTWDLNLNNLQLPIINCISFSNCFEMLLFFNETNCF